MKLASWRAVKTCNHPAIAAQELIFITTVATHDKASVDIEVNLSANTVSASS
jgi:hypothetical protein